MHYCNRCHAEMLSYIDANSCSPCGCVLLEVIDLTKADPGPGYADMLRSL